MFIQLKIHKEKWTKNCKITCSIQLNGEKIYLINRKSIVCNNVKYICSIPLNFFKVIISGPEKNIILTNLLFIENKITLFLGLKKYYLTRLLLYRFLFYRVPKWKLGHWQSIMEKSVLGRRKKLLSLVYGTKNKGPCGC